MTWEVAMRWALHYARTSGGRWAVRGRWVAYGAAGGRWTYVVRAKGDR